MDDVPTLTIATPEALYQRLLGRSWSELAPSIQRAHVSSGQLLATGEFAVRNGSNPAAKLIARIARLPRPGLRIPTRLEIQPFEGGERWTRSFGERRVMTTQRFVSAGLLAERIGRLEFIFELKVDRGSIGYRQAAAAFHLGRWRVSMPSWCMPRVAATETPDESADQVRVRVAVHLPLVGMLLSYDGWMKPTAEASG